MKKMKTNDPETKSTDCIAENIAKLKALFPALLTEGPNGAVIDVDLLKQLVGDESIPDVEEKYGLNWYGKRRARELALTPSIGTLRPCPEESEDWDSTQNLMIEGDNLEVLKLLQKSYAGKVKLIYIDPPYNTGKDFVYPDDFQDSIKSYHIITKQLDVDGWRMSSNTDASGRFHTDWLSMILPRMVIARNLLRPDGVIFISIDDHEVHHLRSVADHVFGAENFICQFIWKSKSGGANDSRHVAADHEYILAYGRDANGVHLNLDTDGKVTTQYNLRDDKGEYALDRLDKQSLGYIESLDFPITGPTGKIYRVEHNKPAQKVARWRWSKNTVAERTDELVFKGDYVYTKNYKKDDTIH